MVAHPPREGSQFVAVWGGLAHASSTAMRTQDEMNCHHDDEAAQSSKSAENVRNKMSSFLRHFARKCCTHSAQIVQILRMKAWTQWEPRHLPQSCV